MITEKDFNESLAEFNNKMKFMEDSLENLYQKHSTSSNPEVKDMVHEIERIQFNSFTNPLLITTESFIHQVKEVIRRQETMENLDKLDKFESSLKAIKDILEFLEI